MLPWIIVFILLAVNGLLFYRLKRRKLAENLACARHEATRAEEKRVFDFLERLGQTLFQEQQPQANTLQRTIVEGAMAVLGAKGAAYYSYDEKKNQLIPSFISQDCPALIELPERTIAQSATNHSALPSFLRLQSVPVANENGVLSHCFTSQETVFIKNLVEDEHFAGKRNQLQYGVSAIIAPLSIGGRRMGVLAVANDYKLNRERPLTEADIPLMYAVAQQSAYGLLNAIAHQEVNAKRILETEVQFARDIQSFLFPHNPPHDDNFYLTGYNRAAKFVSGDCYMWFPVDEKNWGLAIFDVSGKGVPASILMAMCRSLFLAFAPGNTSPAQTLHKVNRLLYPDIRTNMFITVAYAIVNLETRMVNYASAGHHAAMLFRKSTRTVEKIHAEGTAVGFDEGEVMERVTKDISFHVEPGDCLQLFTDGVNEALDRRGNEYGLDRLREVFLKTAPMGIHAVLTEIRTDLDRFLDGHPQSDDITLLGIQFR